MAHSNQHFEATRSRREVLSRHGNKLAQQRAVDQLAPPLLLAYGQREHDGNGMGSIRYLMTDAAMATLTRAVRHTKQVEALTGAYAVVSADDGTVNTIGHRQS
ncbi:hypothetical protein ACQ859_10850 [Roseateles chitinivorans]|uniref:hypothetical protein n=1 Tax=Roseateles chitinivorans TaxID=2917965 RepID=UPI003D66D731